MHYYHTKESNVNTNRIVSTKWTDHKERSFASNYFTFMKFCFSLRTSYKELILYANDPNAHIRTFEYPSVKLITKLSLVTLYFLKKLT